MKNEVAKTNSNLPAEVDFDSAWGADTVHKEHVLIPKILLMQGLSEAVVNEEAQMGEIIESVGNRVIGSGRDKDFKPIDIIPLMSFTHWVVYNKIPVPNKPGEFKLEFKEILDYTPETANLPRETEKESNVMVLNFYVMKKDEMDDDGAIPYLLPFRKTSMSAGQGLVNHFTKCQLAGKPPASKSFKLSAKKRSNDDGTWYVFEVKEGEDVSKDHLMKSFEWFKTIKAKMASGEMEVDHSDLEEGGTKKEKTVNAAPLNENEEQF